MEIKPIGEIPNMDKEPLPKDRVGENDQPKLNDVPSDFVDVLKSEIEKQNNE